MQKSSVDRTTVATNGTSLNVAIAGEGPALLLLHGFPHTWEVWSAVIPELSKEYRVIAPDLRGIGQSSQADGGYDARNISEDMLGLLDELGEQSATVIGVDAGAPPAFLLGLEHSDRVDRLVLIESTIGRLAGAEDFFRTGPPWWFGFHAVPGFAESVLAGNEAAYIDFFLRAGTADGMGPEASIRDAFLAAYSQPGALHRAFEYYRAMPLNGDQIADALTRNRLTVPTLTVGGRVVGDATARQLGPIADDLTSGLIPSSGHIVPLDAPRELLELLRPFLERALR